MTRAVPAAALALALASCAPAGPAREVTIDPGAIRLVLVAPGDFLMGSPDDEPGREAQERRHRVRLTKSFYLGVTEVTQRQWEAVIGGNPSHFTACGPECPVERVNFPEIQAFLSALNARAGGGFRLPTEAEWEYACRAGGTGPFGHLATLGSADANINGAYPYGAEATGPSAGTMPVARFAPNPWGLFDMSGNVWEWTGDWHCPYPPGDATDPVGRCESPHRVIRGGSWMFDGNSARCALRYTHRPQDRGFSLGFRVARTVPSNAP